MTISTLALNTPFLTLYLEQDRGMVFHHVKQSLYCLSPLSVSLLLAIDEFSSHPLAISHVVQISQQPEDEVLKHYQQLKPLFTSNSDRQDYLDARYPELLLPYLESQASSIQGVSRYRIADTIFSVISDCEELDKDISSLLLPCLACDGKIDFQLQIKTLARDSYHLYCNGLTIETAICYQQVLPHLIDRMQVLAFQHSQYVFCFHGAALINNEQCLLLPGKSGVGKSTLTALLTKQGYQLFSDEMIVIDNEFKLMVLNLPIAIKSGSWSVLADEFPSLATQKTWQRTDGRRLKYLWPTNFASSDIQNKQITLVSPRFIAVDEHKPSIESATKQQLSIIETLELLTSSGYQVHQQLIQHDVDRLIAFLAQMTRYRLVYCHSSQALDVLFQS